MRGGRSQGDRQSRRATPAANDCRPRQPTRRRARRSARRNPGGWRRCCRRRRRRRFRARRSCPIRRYALRRLGHLAGRLGWRSPFGRKTVDAPPRAHSLAAMSLTTPSEASSPAPSATERVTVARTVAEVEALRPVWERLPIGNIDADIDHFLAVVAHRREVLRPHVVLIERPGQTDLLAVARLEELPLETRVGYRVVAAPRVRCIIGAFDGVVGADTEEDCRRILDELRRPLRDGEADVVLLPKLDVEGSLYEVAKAAGPWLCRDHAPLVTDHWSVALGEDLEGFLAPRSGKTRRGARNQDKRLQKTYGEALRIRRFESEDELDELCADLETIAAKTYQRQIGAGFTGDEFELALMRDRMRH